MPSAPSLSHKHPVAGYPSGSDIKSSHQKLSFSIDSLVGAANKTQCADKPTDSSPRPGSAGTGTLRGLPSPSPSPPHTQLVLSGKNSHHQNHAADNSSPPPNQQQQAQRRPANNHLSDHHHQQHLSHQALQNAFMGIRNPVSMGQHIGQPHPFGPQHLGHLFGNGQAARSPFDYQSAAFYPWLLARQSPLGHMHGKFWCYISLPNRCAPSAYNCSAVESKARASRAL